MISLEQLQYLLGGGGTVVGPDGNKLGNVGHVYLDDRSGKPEWVTVTTGMFATAASLVPLAHGTLAVDQITVPYDKDKVKDAPKAEDSEDRLSHDQEAELCRYYGITCPPALSDSDLPRGDPRPTPETRTGSLMTSSEEQLQAGPEQIPTDKARLRKYVATEPVTRGSQP